MSIYYGANQPPVNYGCGFIRIQGSSDRKAVGFDTLVYVVQPVPACSP
jgi:hypothetical protein